jgi:hypothetical protein
MGAHSAAHLEAELQCSGVGTGTDHRGRHLGAPVRQRHAVQPALAGEHEQGHCDDQPVPHGGLQRRAQQAADDRSQRGDGDPPENQTDGEVSP